MKEIIENDKEENNSNSEENSGETQYKANIQNLCVFTFVIGLGLIQAGFAISGNNQTAPVIKVKFGWDKEEAILQNTIISAAAIFGIVAGSLTGGRLIQGGRRACLIYFNIMSAAAVTLTMFLNYPLICVGRFLFGFTCGVFSVAGPKMLDETVPIYLSSSFGTASNTFLSGGIMLALVLGVGLPEQHDLVGQQEDGFWRVIYGFPQICQALSLIMLFTMFPEESIGFSISKGNDADALSLIAKVQDSEHKPADILESLKSKSDKAASGVTLGQACCDRKYASSTWIAFFLCFFQQQTGLDGIMIYSNTIFAEMQDKGAISFDGKVGSYIVGCISFAGALLAPIPLNMFGRRTLLLQGQLSMGICLCLTGVFQILDQSQLILLCICIFILSFQFSQGPIAWMQAAEVAVDTALGLCILAMFLSLLEKAITMEFMVHSGMGPHGMFLFLGVITLIGAVFIAVCVKETKGLSDLQKKSLYIPDEFNADQVIDEKTINNQTDSRKNSQMHKNSRKNSAKSDRDISQFRKGSTEPEMLV